ncbi:MAG: dihydrofolate reductase [Actinobacteria bacterium HGW-Actinobacteria-7]|nr:MAG: dihydrofolate reductase [Actinobacteria bacterium HGW-Actinobacteria-7]
MAEIIYYVAASLDGYIATPDGGVGWLAPFESGAEDYGYAEFYASVNAVLLGSHTFEQSLTFGEWPYSGKPTWVFSGRDWPQLPPDVTATSRSPVDVVAQLDASGISRAWLVGGAALATSFRNAGLITEFIVSVMPVILGGGIPLFATDGPTLTLRLVSESVYDDGVVQLVYKPLTRG